MQVPFLVTPSQSKMETMARDITPKSGKSRKKIIKKNIARDTAPKSGKNGKKK